MIAGICVGTHHGASAMSKGYIAAILFADNTHEAGGRTMVRPYRSPKNKIRFCKARLSGLAKPESEITS